MNLSWTDDATDEAGFTVEQSANGGKYTIVATLGRNVTSYTVTGLVPNTTYKFRVGAYNNTTQSAYTAVGTATTPAGSAPATPSNLAAAANAHGQVVLTWTDNATNEDGYYVEQSSAGGNFTRVAIAALPAGSTTYTVGDLTPGTTYKFRVQAYNGAGTSAYSTVQSAKPVEAAAEPAPPSGLTATATAGGIQLAWQHAGDNEDGFKIERSADGGATWSAYATAPANSTGYLAAANAVPGQTYAFRVRAYNNAGDSARSNTASAAAPGATLAAPSGLSASAVADGNQIKLNWTDNTSDETGFEIWQSSTLLATTAPNITQFIAGGFPSAFTTSFQVRAVRSAGGVTTYSGYSSAATGTTWGTATWPNAITGLIATGVAANQVDLTWNDNSSNEDGFQIEYSTDGTNFYSAATVGPNVRRTSLPSTAPGSGPPTLTASTYYTFRVRAFNGATPPGPPSDPCGGSSGGDPGDGCCGSCCGGSGGGGTWTDTSWSTASTYTLGLPAAPTAPGTLTAAAASATQIDLRWSDNSNNEDGFYVERSTNGTTFGVIATLTGTGRSSYADQNLNPNTRYWYRVRAFNLGGESANSNVADATTGAPAVSPAPSNLVATATSANRIDLEWQDNSDNETGFRVERRQGTTGSWVDVGGRAAGATTFTDAGLVGGVTYYYRVRASYVGEAGPFAYSNEAWATASGATRFPYGGTPWPAGGRIEAEKYDAGAEGVTYHDLDATNTGGLYRTDGVDIFRARDPGGYAVGDAFAGEWLEYTINVTGSGPFRLDARVASAGAGGTFTVRFDGGAALGPVTIPDTGGWTKFQTVALPNVSLTPGQHVMRVEMASNGATTGRVGNFNWFQLVAPNAEGIYWNDFQGANDGYWGSKWRTSLTPAGRRRFLGEFGNETVTLDLVKSMPAHEALTVSFDLFLIRSWDGNGQLLGPDIWGMGLQGQTPLIETTFSTHEVETAPTHNNVQAYPSALGGPANPSNTGDDASMRDGLGYTFYRASLGVVEAMSAVYHFTYTFPHTDTGHLALDFFARGLQSLSDESWGIDNIRVTTAMLAPDSLAATPDDAAGRINLAWQDRSTTEYQYQLERSEDGVHFAPLATLAAGATSYADTTAVVGVPYTYRVRALGPSGWSPYSNEAKATLHSAFAPVITGAPFSSPEGTAIGLSGSVNNPNAGAVSYRWSVWKAGAAGGDGELYATGSQANFTFTPDDNGTYLITLTATTAGGGGSNSAQATIQVYNLSPAATILGAPEHPEHDQPIRLTAGVTDPGAADTHTYRWSVYHANTEWKSGTARDLEFTPDEGGSYDVVLTVTDDDGGTSVATEHIDVGFGNPAVTITGAPATSVEGASIRMGSRVLDPGNNPYLRYSWSATKDGLPYDGLNVPGSREVATLLPDDNGQYVVSLTVSGGANGPVTARQTIDVANANPVPTVGGDQASGPEGDVIRLVAGVADAGSIDMLSAFQYAWEVRKNGALYRAAEGPRAEFAPNDGSNYDVTLKVIDKDGGEGTATRTFAVVPNQPSHLKATPLPGNRVHLVWSDNSSVETKFEVQAKADGEQTFTKVVEVPADATYAVAPLTLTGNNYTFRVAAIAANGTALAYSETVPQATIAAAPTSLNALAVSNTQVALWWDDTLNTSAAQYAVEYRTERDDQFTPCVGSGAGTQADPFKATGLRHGTTYFFRVQAFHSADRSNASPYSGVADATTPSATPATPSLTSAVASGLGTIRLTWTYPTGAVSPDEFEVEQSTDGKHYGIAQTLAPVGGGTGTKTADVIGLDPETEYYFRVRASSDKGALRSAYSAALSATTVPFPAPTLAAPVALSNRTVDVSWADNSTGESGFELLYKRKDEGDAAFRAPYIVSYVSPTHVVVGLLDAHTTYVFKVRAIYQAGSPLVRVANSAFAGPAEATTTNTPPAAPTNLVAAAPTATTPPGQVVLNWLYTQVEPADNLEVEYTPAGSPLGGSASKVLLIYQPTATTGTVTGLPPSADYQFRVRAANGAGKSAWSNTVPGQAGALAAPSGVGANALSNTQIAVTWTDNATNEAGFEIETTSDEPQFKRTTVVNGTGIATGTVAPVTVSDLRPNKAYQVRVRAIYGGVTSAWSTVPASAITKNEVPDDPTDLVATSSAQMGAVDLAWDMPAVPSSGNELADEFVVERQTGPDTFAEAARFKPTTTTGHQEYTVTGLSWGVSYGFRVRALNAAGYALNPTAVESAVATAASISVPQNLTAVARSPGRIDLAWDGLAGNEDGFKVEVSTDNVSWSHYGTTVGTATTFTAMGLTATTTYYFRLRAFNVALESDPSASASATTGEFAEPTNLTATALSTTAINLSWTDNNSGTGQERGFLVEQSEDGVNFTTIANSHFQVPSDGTPTNMRAFLATDLVPGRTYYFRVRSFGDDQVPQGWWLGLSPTERSRDTRYYSKYSSVVAAAPDPMLLPGAPTQLAAEVLPNGEVRLSWDDIDGEDGYEVLIWSGGLDVPDGKVGADVTTYVVSQMKDGSPLKGGTPYEFRVRPVNIAGKAAPSDMAFVITRPDRPTGVRATAQAGTEVQLSWDATTGAGGYRVERSADGTTWSEITSAPLTTAGYTDTPPTAPHPYLYRVVAAGARGALDSTDPNFDPDDVSAPSEPVESTLAGSSEGLTATPLSDSQVRLEWLAVAGAIGYAVERAPAAGGGPWEALPAPPAGALAYTDAGLTEGRAYKYRVTANGNNGLFRFDPVVTSAQPAAPTALLATVVSGSRAELSWSNASNNASGFQIEYRTDATGWTRVDAKNAHADYPLLAAFEPSTKYSFRVRSYNEFATSAYSDIKAVTTPAYPESPATFTAASSQAGQVSLAWTPPPSYTSLTLERSDDKGVHWRPLSTFAATAPASYDDNTVIEGQSYQYRIWASNAAGNSFIREIAADVRVAAPTFTSLQVVSGDEVQLEWAKLGTAPPRYVRISRSADSGATFQVLATVSATAGRYTAAGPYAPSQAYVFMLEAFAGSPDAPKQTSAAVTSEVNTTAFPGAPVSLQEEVSDAGVTLTWGAGAGPAPDGYRVERWDAAANSGAGLWVAVATVPAGQVLRVTDDGPPEGTRHRYRVGAFNAAGDSGFAVRDVDVSLNAPVGLKVTVVSGHQIELTWADRSVREAGFRIYQRQAGQTDWVNVGEVLAGTTQFTIPGPIDPATTYSYHVEAYSSQPGVRAGVGAAVSVTTPNFPAPPTDLLVTHPTDPAANPRNQLDLAWTAGAGATSYKIYRKRSSQPWAVLASGVAQTHFEDTTVEPSYTYTYYVVGVNNEGESSASESEAGSPLYRDTRSPTDLTVTSVTTSDVTLSWKDHSAAESGFKIEYSLNGLTWLTDSYVNLVSNAASVAGDNAEVTRTYSFPSGGPVPVAGQTVFFRISALHGGVPTEASNVAYGIVGGGTAPGSNAPAGFPLGPPAEEAPELWYQVRLNGQSEWTFYGTMHGHLKFKSSWIRASSPQDAMQLALEEDEVYVSRPGEPDLQVPFMDPAFFQIDKLDWVQGMQGTESSNFLLSDPGEVQSASFMTASLLPDEPPPKTPDYGESDIPGDPGSWNPGKGGYYNVHSSGYSKIERYWNSQCMRPMVIVRKGTVSGQPPGNEPGYPSPGTDPSPSLDADVDSDNDHYFAYTQEEDPYETNAPGQYVPVNDGDNEGIPAWADGFDRFTDGVHPEADDAGAGNFIPLRVQLSPLFDRPLPPDPTKGRIHRTTDPVVIMFNYAGSDPAGVEREGDGTPASPYQYELPEDGGPIRIWTGAPGGYYGGYYGGGYYGGYYGAAGSAAGSRHKESVGSLDDGQDMMPAGSYYVTPGQPFEAYKIFGYQREAYVWIEMLKPDAGTQSITVTGFGAGGSGVGNASDTVVVTPLPVDVDIDSDNTATDEPERTPEEDQGESTYGQPGKVVVVNDADRDADGVPDFDDGFDDNEQAHGHFVPLVVDLASTLDLTKASLRINYDASDPADVETVGSGNSVGYKPAPGYFRLWTKDQYEARLAGSILNEDDPGNFVPAMERDENGEWKPIDYQGDKLAALGFSNTNRKVTFYLEAVRPLPASSGPGATPTVSVSLDPDGVDLDVHSPTEGDEKPAPYIVADQVNVTPVEATDPGYAGAVRYFDGAISLPATDLLANGFGGPWGHERVWSNAAELVAPSANGTGMEVASWPHLVQASSAIIAVIGGRSLFFDRDGTDYTARFGGLEQLRLTDGAYVLTDAAGNQYQFYDFDPKKKSPQRGGFDRFRDAGGNETVATYDTDGHISKVDRGATTIEYAYYKDADGDPDSKGLLRKVTLSNPKMTRTAEFKYYSKADGDTADGASFRGNLNDLKSVVVKEGTTVLSNSHYRYYKRAAGATRSQLKYALEGAAYERAKAALGDPTAAGADIAPYANDHFSVSGTTVSHDVLGAGAYGLGQTTTIGMYSYQFETNPDDATGFNVWKYKTTETLPDQTTRTVFTNFAGQIIATATQPTNLAAGSDTTHPYLAYTRYDEYGRPVLSAGPSAVDPASYNAAQPSPGVVSLLATQGLVNWTDYYDQADPSAGQVHTQSISRGENGTKVKQAEFTYEPREFSDTRIQLLASEKYYRNTDGSGAVTTTYEYDPALWSAFQPLKVTVTPPIVSTTQNGSGFAEAVIEEFDAFGRLRRLTHGDGAVDETDYDDDTGAVIRQAIDVNGLDLETTTVEWDGLGRARKIDDPDPAENLTTIDYEESAALVTVTTTPPAGPVRQVRQDFAQGKVETWATVPDGTLQKVASDDLDLGGRVVSSHRYPGDGSDYVTQYRYDAGGRQNWVMNAVGTIAETKYDGLGRPTKVSVGTSAAGLTDVQTNAYDGGNVGDGNLTQSVAYPGGGALPRQTDLYYDWRDRLVAGQTGSQVFYDNLDNLGNVTNHALYDGAVSAPSADSDGDGVPQSPLGNARRAWTQTSYDDRSRPYMAREFNLNQTNGGLISLLTTYTWYDQVGRVIKSGRLGGAATKTQYDGAGRVTGVFVADASGDAAAGLTASLDDARTLVGDTIVTQAETQYDQNSNAIFETTKDRRPDGSYRASYVGHWHDAIGRVTDTVDFGTHGGTAMAARPTIFPSRSDTTLITSYTYDQGGSPASVTDPRGIVTLMENDALGRQKKVTEAAGSGGGFLNLTTTYLYDGLDRQTSVTRAGQTTAYTYQGASVIGAFRSNDYLSQVTYPGGGQESLWVNALGEVTRRVERSGLQHDYEYDALGNQTSDAVSSLPAGVDDTVTKRTVAYDALSRPVLFTSKGADDAVVNQVLRSYNGYGQVTDEFQSHAGVVHTSATPEAPVTPHVHYTYSNVGGESRLASVQYPDGRTVQYGYATGLDSALGRVSSVSDDVVGTIESYEYLGAGAVVKRTQAESGLVGEVGFDDLGRVNDVLWQLATDGTLYPTEHLQYGYDRDGNRLYTNNVISPANSELYHASYDPAYGPFVNGYDALNRMTEFRRGTLSASAGGGGQLDTVAAPSFYQRWNLDLGGNWEVFDNNGTRYDYQYENDRVKATATTTAAYSGTGSVTSQTNVPTTGTAFPFTPRERNATYDAWQQVLTSSYQTKDVDGKDLVGTASYQYDALGRPIVERSTLKKLTGDPQNPEQVLQDRELELYYDQDGNVIQERLVPQGGGPAATYRENVFSPVDGSLVFAETVNDGQPQNRFRLYAVKDAAGSVTATVALQQLTGMPQPQFLVLERYQYTPSGSVTFLNPNWTVSATPGDSLANWRYYHQGMRFNFGDGLYHAGGRAYDPFLGRWVQPDDAKLFGAQNPYTSGGGDGGGFGSYAKSVVTRQLAAMWDEYNHPSSDWPAGLRVLSRAYSEASSIYTEMGDRLIAGGAYWQLGIPLYALGKVTGMVGGLLDPVPGLSQMASNTMAVQRRTGSTTMAGLYAVGSFTGLTQVGEAWAGRDFATLAPITGLDRGGHFFAGLSQFSFSLAGSVNRFNSLEQWITTRRPASAPQIARLMGDPAGSVRVTMAQRLAARQKLGSLVTQLEREGTIELRRGMYAGEGWRQMLGDLTVATGREVGIARVDGVRVLRIGDVDAINFADASRVIAHTHPSGILHFSGGDIFDGFRVYQPGQTSSILVGPTGAAVRRPTVFRMPLDVLNPDFIPRVQP